MPSSAIVMTQQEYKKTLEPTKETPSGDYFPAQIPILVTPNEITQVSSNDIPPLPSYDNYNSNYNSNFSSDVNPEVNPESNANQETETDSGNTKPMP